MKGLYKKALKGEIQGFTGVSDPYEEPLNPELVVETDKETVEESTKKIIKKLIELNYLKPERVVHPCLFTRRRSQDSRKTIEVGIYLKGNS